MAGSAFAARRSFSFQGRSSERSAPLVITQHTRRLLTGLSTFVPGVRTLSERSTGGTVSPEYCFQIWLRHLMLAASVELPTDPHVVAELGPGDSLGTGVAALLTGASTYIAVDLVEYAASAKNVEMVAAISDLLSRRAPVPGIDGLGPDEVAESLVSFRDPGRRSSRMVLLQAG